MAKSHPMEKSYRHAMYDVNGRLGVAYSFLF